METKAKRGIIEWMSPVWNRSCNFHPELEEDGVYTEVFLQGVREPIEVPGALSDSLIGRTVRIIETSEKGPSEGYETVRCEIYSNPTDRKLYNSSFTRKIL